MNKRNLDPMFASQACRLVQSHQILAHLLSAMPSGGLKDVNACVNAIESIVFELLARHLDSASRGDARRAYHAGIAAGLNDLKSDEGGAAVRDESEGGRSDALLKVITQAGWDHGRAIRHWIALRHTEESVSGPGDSGNAGFRGATSASL